MSGSLLLELGLLLVLVLANGMLAGAEIAVLTVRPARLRELAASGSRSARALLRMRRKPERFLSTVQVGITVIGAGAGAFGGTAFAPDLAPWIARVPPLEPHADAVALVLAVLIVSYLTVVLGELVPKSLALRVSERYALLAVRPLAALSLVARPLVALLTASSNLILRLFGDRTSFLEARLSPEELRAMVDEASRGGSLDVGAGEIASRAIDLGELDASDVMVHRRFVVALDVEAGPEEVRTTLLERGHQRVPVYEGTIDVILGYVSWNDLVERLLRQEPIDLRTLLRPCLLVPEAKPAPALLEEMRSQRVHLAIVVDEHGGTAGLVTLEDLLEELVGEIASEHDPAPPELVVRSADGSALVVGATPLRELNRALGLDLDGPPGRTTLGGLCIELAEGRIPTPGESFLAPDGTRLEVLEASRRRVLKVRVVPRPAVPVDGEG